jgi:signal transduction histidine kinase
MLPKVVLHKKNGHSHVPAKKGLSAGEMLRLVHSGRRPAVKPAAELLQFANVVRTEKTSALEEQVRHSIDGLEASLGDAVMRTEQAFARGELSDVHEHLEALRSQADQAARLVTDFVNAARTRGADRRVTNLNDLVTQTAMRLRSRLPGDVTFQFQLDSSLPAIVGNAGQLEQALAAVIAYAVNAMAASGQGAVMAETSQGPVAFQGERTVRLRILDEGPGLSADMMERLFTAPSLPALLEGELARPVDADLGLAFQIVKEHSGVLAAANRPEGGACFTLDFPAA